jgi:hypothetical protein
VVIPLVPGLVPLIVAFFLPRWQSNLQRLQSVSDTRVKILTPLRRLCLWLQKLRVPDRSSAKDCRRLLLAVPPRKYQPSISSAPQKSSSPAALRPKKQQSCSLILAVIGCWKSRIRFA